MPSASVVTQNNTSPRTRTCWCFHLQPTRAWDSEVPVYTFRYYSNAGNAVVLRGRLCERDRVEEEEEEEEEEEGLFRANAVNEEDPERDRATQV